MLALTGALSLFAGCYQSTVDKSCHVDSDCVVATRRVGCCEALEYVGVAAGGDTTLPDQVPGDVACACDSEPRTEDGAYVEGGTVVAECVDDECRATVAE